MKSRWSFVSKFRALHQARLMHCLPSWCQTASSESQSWYLGLIFLKSPPLFSKSKNKKQKTLKNDPYPEPSTQKCWRKSCIFFRIQWFWGSVMDKSRRFLLLMQESKASYPKLLGRHFKFSVTKSMTCWCPKQQL